MPTLPFVHFGAPLLVLMALFLIASTARADGRSPFSPPLPEVPAGGRAAGRLPRAHQRSAGAGTTDSDDVIPPLCVVRSMIRAKWCVRVLRSRAWGGLARGSVRLPPAPVGDRNECIREGPDQEGPSTFSMLKRRLGRGGGETPAVAECEREVLRFRFEDHEQHHALGGRRRTADRRWRHLRLKLAELGEYQLVLAEVDRRRQGRDREAPAQGILPGVSVDKLDYSDGNPRVHVKIAVFSYLGA